MLLNLSSASTYRNTSQFVQGVRVSRVLYLLAVIAHIVLIVFYSVHHVSTPSITSTTPPTEHRAILQTQSEKQYRFCLPCPSSQTTQSTPTSRRTIHLSPLQKRFQSAINEYAHPSSRSVISRELQPRSFPPSHLPISRLGCIVPSSSLCF